MGRAAARRYMSVFLCVVLGLGALLAHALIVLLVIAGIQDARKPAPLIACRRRRLTEAWPTFFSDSVLRLGPL